ncbi:MAG: sulfurtransferase [Bacteroidia bacterium]|nr:sulfurtransferase [Bacteroidia bacterium]
MYRHYYMIAWILLICWGALSCASPRDNTRTQSCLSVPVLVEPEFIFNRISTRNPTFILELGKNSPFIKGHIPGAKRSWRTAYSDMDNYPYGGMKADSQQIRMLLQAKGLNKNDSLFLYDRKGNVDAARFMWILKTYGFHNSFLINGGWEKWKKRGFPVDSLEETKGKRGNFSFKEDQQKNETVIVIGQVEEALSDSNWIILDNRSLDEFSGRIMKKGAFRKGRIPGSIHLDWIDMININEDHSFKKCEEIELILQEKGILPSKKIITYCHSGVRSAHMVFVLREIMGYPYVWNYDGSWTEWSYFHELPIAM